MDLSENAIELLKNDEVARGIVKRLLDAKTYYYTHVEGKDAEIGTGGY
jgi:hypothetical protein